MYNTENHINNNNMYMCAYYYTVMDQFLIIISLRLATILCMHADTMKVLL